MRIAFTHNVQREATEAEAEFDTPATIAAITAALENLGHEVEPIDVGTSVGDLIHKLTRFAPDLIFNTAEGHHGRHREAFYPALFDQLGLPYTGSDAHTCALTLDKRLTRVIVAAAGVPVPWGWFTLDPEAPFPEGMTLPAIVKPNYEGSSKGITADSVVETPEALRACLRRILAQYPEGALIEAFIEGRDVVVPMIEGSSPETRDILAASEYAIDETVTGPRKRAIYDYDLKNSLSSAVSVRTPAALEPELARDMARHARAAFTALEIRDLGRIDFRVTPDGQLYFIEANALPSLEPGASIYEAAALLGFDTLEAVLGKVVSSALRRQGLPETLETPAPKLRVGLLHNIKRIQPGMDGDNDEEAEFDAPTTINAIAEAIAHHGHEVVLIEAGTELTRRISEARIDLAFNVAEGLRGRGREALVPALLEHLDIPYTGSDPATLAVTLDKRLAKQIVRHAGLRTPGFVVMLSPDEPLPAGMAFPLIVKPVAEGSSKGVGDTSVARDADQLRNLISAITSRYAQGALVEEFVGGREFTVGILGDVHHTVLPPMEIVFMPKAGPLPVYSFTHKQAFNDLVRFDAPAQVDAELDHRLRKAALDAFLALGCRDVARIDLRLDDQGAVHFIECNPLPGLTPEWSDLCLIATSAEMNYHDLIGAILSPALERWRQRQLTEEHP